MGLLMLIIDGAEDTDFNICQNIQKIKDEGRFGAINNTPIGMEANSLNCIMNILGVPKNSIPSGRAYLEAISLGEEIADEDLIFRCNDVKFENNVLTDSCSVKERKTITLANPNLRLISMDGYKNLLIIKNAKKYEKFIVTYPPHENIGRNIYDILPKCENQELAFALTELMFSYGLYPWGQAVKQSVDSFYDLHRKNGAVVCKTEIVRGIAKAMGMYCPDLSSATADIDTDLQEKSEMALKLSLEYDFVLLHINGADEAAHRRNKAEKESFIRKIDSEVVLYLMKNINQSTTLMITSDHGTNTATGKHINSPVNYYIYNYNEENLKWLKQS